MPCHFYIAAFLYFLSFCTHSFTGQARECQLDQKSDLLQLRSLIFQKSQSVYCKTSLEFPRSHKIASWNTSTSDCCTWSGITCNPDTGNVISINLGCNPLRSSSMYSSRLLSITTNDRLSNNSSDICPHKTNTSPSLLFQKLSKLRVLIFDGLDMSSIDLRLFTNLPSSLQVLSFHCFKLQGYFPVEVFLLPNLKCPDFSLNLDLYGHLPRSSWSSPLEILDLSSTSFFGELPAEKGNLKSLQVLWLRECNFTGSLPALLGNLTQLTRLDLLVKKLTGQIPSPFSNLQSLILFFVSSNNFLGPIPDMFINMAKLLYLDFSNNRFNASIPMSLLSIPSMVELDLSNDLLSGHIERVQAISLRRIRLFGNQLEGSIPPLLTDLSNLTTSLLSSNRFTGLFDLKTLSQISKMETLDLSHNMISLNNVDHDFDVTLPSLSSLRLSGCILTKFPTFVRTLRNLITLELSSNRIQGRIPTQMWEVGSESLAYLNLSNNLPTILEQVPWVNLLFLDLHYNKIQGPIPTQLPNSIILFSISDNEFVRHIPTPTCRAKSLEILDLPNNHLSSTIPHYFSTILEVLDFQGNQISGSLSNFTFQESNNLRSIHLNRNKLEDQLSQLLMNCQRVEVLNLGVSMSSDTFPSWLDAKPNFWVLVIQSNQFHGTINHPDAEFPFPQLRILHISFNKFFKLLPETYFQSTIAIMSKNKNEQKLQYEGICHQDSIMVTTKGSGMPLGKILSIFSTLDFSSNSFEGPILDTIGNLFSLKGFNHLIGAIPPSLGKLSELEWSYMSSHELAGRIPNELTQLTSRVILNLFDSHLVEPIPHGNRFNAYPTGARAGYRGLCGFPLSKTNRIFQNPIMMLHQIHNKESLLSEHVIEFLGVGCLCGVVIGLIIEGLLCRRWHHAIERGFEFFTWSFTPTWSTIKCYFRSTKHYPKTRGPFVAVAVVIILILFLDPAASTLAFSNQCSTPITICNINASGPIIVQPNKAYSMEPSASLKFWAYKKSRDNMCTNMENPVATLAVIDFDNNGCSYGVSVAYGYNLGVKIMAIGGTGCLPAACTARLEDCPDNLKARGPDNVVIACNPPNCTESTMLCSLYSSLMGNSQCQKPGSSDQYSSKNARCDLPVDLAIIFKCD